MLKFPLNFVIYFDGHIKLLFINIITSFIPARFFILNPCFNLSSTTYNYSTLSLFNLRSRYGYNQINNSLWRFSHPGYTSGLPVLILTFDQIYYLLSYTLSNIVDTLGLRPSPLWFNLRNLFILLVLVLLINNSQSIQSTLGNFNLFDSRGFSG